MLTIVSHRSDHTSLPHSLENSAGYTQFDRDLTNKNRTFAQINSAEHVSMEMENYSRA